MTIPDTLLLAVLMSAPLAATTRPSAPDGLEPVWDARAAEHLLNRAGFGARRAEIDAAVATGRDATIERLVSGGRPVVTPFFAERFSARDGVLEEQKGAAKASGMTQEEFREQNTALLRELRVAEGEQAVHFVAWWVERMTRDEDPLRERMTLFWHGWFTSSIKAVQSSFEMVNQNELLRANALGRFSDLVHAVAKDPAMLEYLDNDKNRKGAPNENFARELMELFTLGEGNYTEDDVREVARAFTGWTDENGEFAFHRRAHDDGQKTVLGRTGELGGEDVLDILLEQDACPRYLAAGLIEYFEGARPTEDRVAAYAELLRASKFDVSAFLRHLFADPAFYRDEVVGTRVAGPVDFVVGVARRLAVDVPGRALALATESLGQRLFDPPTVRGWEEGTAWISTSTLMQRGNLAGIFLGLGQGGAAPELDAMAAGRGSPPSERGGSAERGERGRPAEPGREAARGRGTERARGAAAPSESMMDGSMMMGGGEPVEGDDEREDPVSRTLRRAGWVPYLNFLTQLRREQRNSDADIVERMLDELLAVEPTAEARDEALRFLRAERERLELADGELLQPRRAEHSLRRLAHLILSLPEASLN